LAPRLHGSIHLFGLMTSFVHFGPTVDDVLKVLTAGSRWRTTDADDFLRLGICDTATTFAPTNSAPSAAGCNPLLTAYAHDIVKRSLGYKETLHDREVFALLWPLAPDLPWRVPSRLREHCSNRPLTLAVDPRSDDIAAISFLSIQLVQRQRSAFVCLDPLLADANEVLISTSLILTCSSCGALNIGLWKMARLPDDCDCNSLMGNDSVKFSRRLVLPVLVREEFRRNRRCLQ
jgi:hypothetical protein